MPTPKAEETGRKILEAALSLFRVKGFDATTMREIARESNMAIGAAYYYYPSKEAIVLDFYQRSCAELQPKIAAALEGVRGLEDRLRVLISVKLAHFEPNRGILRSLLRNGADPRHPLSPLSPETAGIRNLDIEGFRGILADCGVRLPRDLAPHLPGVFWFLQMGVIFFWVIDESPRQARTARLLDLAAKSAAFLVRAASLPLMRPLRKTAVQLIQTVTGAAEVAPR